MNESFTSFIILGVLTGILAGFFGVGGGIILVPALVLIFHFTQHQAQGMSLGAMLLPVGLLGVMSYYNKNPFPIKPTLWIALGILFGTLLGAMIAQQIPPKQLKVGFGVFVVLAGLKIIFGK